MEDKISRKDKAKPQVLANTIILAERPKKEDLEAHESIDYMYLNIPSNSTSGKCIIKIPRFDACAPEEWIIFVNLVQKALVGQSVTTGPPIYKYMEKILKGDAKAEFTQQAKLIGSCTVENFNFVMAIVTVHIFPLLVYQD